VVVGAGVVGLAVARALALRGCEVLVLEAAASIGTGISSRNSEVIHAGIYYPEGSLKARLCVRGKQMLYDYCAARGVGHKRCGKLLVAVSAAQAAALPGIIAKAARNGVTDLSLLTQEQARALEPALECVAAIHSPSTGIVDSHALMLALQADLENAGGVIAFNSPLAGVEYAQAAIKIEATDGTRLQACTQSPLRETSKAWRPNISRRPTLPKAIILRWPGVRRFRTWSTQCPTLALTWLGLVCISRWTWAARRSLAPMCNGLIRPTILRCRPIAAAPFMPRCASTGLRCQRVRSFRLTLASARKSAGLGSPPQIFWSRAVRSTACLAWSTSLVLNHRGSQAVWRSGRWLQRRY
jgi:FAD dependent oxidoreductase